MNLPAGVTQSDISNLSNDVAPGAQDNCCVCLRYMEYDSNRGFWRFDDIHGDPATVVSVKHGEYVCGPRCHSQYVYNNSTPQEREDMRLMAQMCEAWLKVEYSRRQWSFWSYSLLDIDPVPMNDAINSYLAAFGMEDGENPPAWYCAAVNAPHGRPMREVRRVGMRRRTRT